MKYKHVSVQADTAGLSAMSASVIDGVLTCQYTQTRISNHSQVTSLHTDWFLLVANGYASQGECSFV